MKRCLVVALLAAPIAFALLSRAEDGVTQDATKPLMDQSEPAKENFQNALKVRDPFRPPQSTSGSSLSELEAFPTESFRMLGMVSGPKRVRAMIQSPGGKTFIVSERMKIGRRKGFITRITPEKVVVREKILNVFGQEEDTAVEIRLPSDTKLELEADKKSESGG